MAALYESRLDAAAQVAQALAEYDGARPLVLAIARGAVSMGAAIADALGGELEVALVRRLRAPFCPQLSVGAIEESGMAFIAPHASGAGADAAFLAGEKAAQILLLRHLGALYRGARPKRDPAGRNVIVVDDGMATGMTMAIALIAARSRGAGRLVCAVPVAPAQTIFELAPCADEFVCLEVPERFDTVDRFYRSFPAVTHEDAARFLSRRVAARV